MYSSQPSTKVRHNVPAQLLSYYHCHILELYSRSAILPSLQRFLNKSRVYFYFERKEENETV